MPVYLSLHKHLAELVSARISPAARAWFDDISRSRAEGEMFANVFTTVARRLGKAPIDLTPADAEALAAAGVTWPLGGWALDELGRVALLLRVVDGLETERLALVVEECYHRGDNRERQAVLKALPFLPHGERVLAIGVDACRTSVVPLFEAIACENPYPADRFPDLNFNQMVLKALFLGISIDRVVGLDRRLTPELGRMASDYASERRAAGRSVPGDIARLTG